MTVPGRQLVLDLPHAASTSREDFLPGASNETGLKLVESWPGWPHPWVVLAGPEGSGKTHLARVWAELAGAETMAAAELTDTGSPTAHRTRVIEDADRGIGSQPAFFHLMNLAREQSGHLLITGRTPPGDWDIALPDLRSRLRACPVVTLTEPDEQLLRAVLVKLLADRQLPATPAGVAYLARHLDRSMAPALAVVEAIDRLLWDRPGELTRDVARRALTEIGKSGDDD